VTIVEIGLLGSLVPGVLAWEMERPFSPVSIQERTETSKTDGVVSVGLGVHLDYYSENHPSYGGDVFDLRLFATANTRKVVSYGLYSSSFYWHDNLPSKPGGGTLYLGDNDGWWVDMYGIIARFYGGANSANIILFG